MLLISEKKAGGGLIREESAGSCEEGGRDTAASVNGCPSETQRAFTRAACALRKLLKSFISCFRDGRCYTVTIYCYKEPVMLTRPWIVLVSDSRWGETRREFCHWLLVIFSWWYELLLKNERKDGVVNTVTYWREIRGSVMYKFSKIQSQQFVVPLKSVHLFMSTVERLLGNLVKENHVCVHFHPLLLCEY